MVNQQSPTDGLVFLFFFQKKKKRVMGHAHFRYKNFKANKTLPSSVLFNIIDSQPHTPKNTLFEIMVTIPTDHHMPPKKKK
jgi:hypothetical protein